MEATRLISHIKLLHKAEGDRELQQNKLYLWRSSKLWHSSALHQSGVNQSKRIIRKRRVRHIGSINGWTDGWFYCLLLSAAATLQVEVNCSAHVFWNKHHCLLTFLKPIFQESYIYFLITFGNSWQLNEGLETFLFKKYRHTHANNTVMTTVWQLSFMWLKWSKGMDTHQPITFAHNVYISI